MMTSFNLRFLRLFVLSFLSFFSFILPAGASYQDFVSTTTHRDKTIAAVDSERPTKIVFRYEPSISMQIAAHSLSVTDADSQTMNSVQLIEEQLSSHPKVSPFINVQELTTRSGLQALTSSTSSIEARRLERIARIKKSISENDFFNHLYILELDSDMSQDEIEILKEELLNIDGVSKIYQDHKYHTFDIHTPHASLDQWALDAIGASEAWASGSTGSGIMIAVIDSGVEWDHDDLEANIYTNPGETANNGIDDDNNGYIDDDRGWDFVDNDNNPYDDHGHGTHVAGIAAAVANDSSGIVGASYGATILPIRGLDSLGGFDSDLADAIIYAGLQGADVINCSWGGEGRSNILTNVINAVSDAGVIVVAAAGNDNKLAFNNYPSALPNVISVGAVDENLDRASFSNYGNYVDIAAPGDSIISTDLGNTHSLKSGTSMAAPYVSSAVAMLLESNSALNFDQIKEQLSTYSTQLVADPLRNIGSLINLEALSLDININKFDINALDKSIGGAYLGDIELDIAISGLDLDYYDIEYRSKANNTWYSVGQSSNTLQTVVDLSSPSLNSGTLEFRIKIVSNSGFTIYKSKEITWVAKILSNIEDTSIDSLYSRATLAYSLRKLNPNYSDTGLSTSSILFGARQNLNFDQFDVLDLSSISSNNIIWTYNVISQGNQRLTASPTVAEFNTTINSNTALIGPGSGGLATFDMLTVPNNSLVNRERRLRTRSVNAVLETAADTNSRQFIFEQGNAGRGFNLYIQNNRLIMGAWKQVRGRMRYRSTHIGISPNTKYLINMIITSGRLYLYVNGQLMANIRGFKQMRRHGQLAIGGVDRSTRIRRRSNRRRRHRRVRAGGPTDFRGKLYDFTYFNEDIRSQIPLMYKETREFYRF